MRAHLLTCLVEQAQLQHAFPAVTYVNGGRGGMTLQEQGDEAKPL